MPIAAWWMLILPLIAGAMLPTQAGFNGQIARHISSFMGASLISFSVGTLAIFIVTLCLRELPSVTALKGLNAWQWSTGMMGAFYICTAVLVAPKIGASLFMALILAGQLTMAITLDHFGWAGYKQTPISLEKIAGVLLIFVGVILIRRG